MSRSSVRWWYRLLNLRFLSLLAACRMPISPRDPGSNGSHLPSLRSDRLRLVDILNGQVPSLHRLR